jgi:hypothetical protein
MADDFASVPSEAPVSSAPEAPSSSPAPEQSSSQPSPASQPTQSAAPAQQQVGYWDRFKSLPEFQGQDDRAIAARLYQAMEREKAAAKALAQYQQVIPYAQEYITYRPEFQKWRASQQQAQQAPQQQAAPQPQKWWSPPEVKESYKRYLTKDENGREIIHPDAPIDARNALLEYQNYKADFAHKFLANPEEALGPMVQEMAAKQAQELIQQTMAQKENESFVSQIEKDNEDWLFDKETGNVTPEGLLVHKYIEQAREKGIGGPQARWEYAVAMTERDMLAQQFDQQQQQQSQVQQSVQQFMAQQAQAPRPAPQPAAAPPRQPDVAQQNMQYLRKEASRNPSRSAGTATNDPRAPKPKMTFEQMLREEASSRGFI